MASTAEPPTEPRTEREEPPGEMSPLLNLRPPSNDYGKQPDGRNIIWNFVLDGAWLAQIGVIALVVIVLVSVFDQPILLVSGHPLSQIVGLFAIIQSILVLQPTRLNEHKTEGQRWHALIHVVSFLSFVAGITVIEYNKVHNNLEHFHSAHAYIGVIACGVLVFQYLLGVTMWAVPSLYGGDDNAKRLWKFHRWIGYMLVLLLLGSVISATQTEYARDLHNQRTIYASVASVFLVYTLIIRVSAKKLGLKE